MQSRCGRRAPYAEGINRVITQQGTRISFNHILGGLGVGFFILIAVVWLPKPPWHTDTERTGKSAGH